MTVYIGVRVKLRMFGVTYGVFERTYKVSVGPNGIGVRPSSSVRPDNARVLFDDHGVTVWVWV